jgi:hypothetical protein
MAVNISREAPFGAGSKGYRFSVHRDEEKDRQIYEAGRKLEETRFRKGSLSQLMFERLSVKSETPESETVQSETVEDTPKL